jgi:DHA1 family arabinose polymer transporter-like MFS transporter
MYVGYLRAVRQRLGIFGDDFLTGVTTFALVPSLTLLLLNSVKSDAEMLVASLGPACFNIANALGAFLGGVPINQGYGYTSPALVGAVMAALGIVISLCYIQRSKKQWLWLPKGS